MKTRAIRLHETRARLTCESFFLDLAMAALRQAHADLRAYRERHAEFFRTFSPVSCRPGAPRIARHMAAAARRTGTGPMAGVAGAVGLAVVRALAAAGARHVIFENGGDIAMILDHPVNLAIYAGPHGPAGMGLRLEPRRGIQACCTSSGTVGHSFSYGRADAAVVLADDPVLADAAATALGNRLRRPGNRSMAAALRQAPWRGVRAMIAVMGGRIACMGDLPAWIPVNPVSAQAAAGEVHRATA